MRIPGPVILLPMFLAGCALPPAVTVASFIADGVSLATTGKSTADHALSAVANEDCALFRAVNGKEICDPDGDVLIAFADAQPIEESWFVDHETGLPDDFGGNAQPAANAPETMPQSAAAAAPGASGRKPSAPVAVPALTPGPVGQIAPRSAPSDAVSTAAMPSPADAEVALPKQEILKADLPQQHSEPATRVIQSSGQVSTFAVIGSFRDVENARRMRSAFGDDGLIQTIVVDGKRTHRVLLDRPVEQARRDGFSDAWPVRLCAGAPGQPPCGHYVVSKEGVYVETASR